MAEGNVKKGPASAADLEQIVEALQVELGIEVGLAPPEAVPNAPAGAPAAELADLGRRTRRRLDRQELRRHINLESIARLTLTRLRAAPAAAARLDPAWLARFAEAAADVVAEPLQDLWARALAAEALHPGAIQLRTLVVLRDLAQPHVELFQRFACFVINNFAMRLEESFFEGKGIAPDDFLTFEELGLMRPGTGQIKTFKSQNEDRYITHLLYRDQVLRVSHETNKKPLNLPCYRLTQAGADLAEILPIQEDAEYVVAMTNWLSKRGYHVAQARINARADRNTVTSHTRFCELVPYDRRRYLKRMRG